MMTFVCTDTTDVQKVSARQIGNTVQVQCDFISSSDAKGCMVVLVGVTTNTTVNVNRCDICNSGVLKLMAHSLSCYRKVFALDIEVDGSVGSLAIYGELTSDDKVRSCKQQLSSGE